ncbi:MAG: glycoside hydrolase family 65 protein [Firmicutes bacterium]|nr:glycoside hydrolase family 65 protein [Bacillota bacterium]
MKEIIIKEVNYDEENYAHFGTKFLIGNGYMGVRGSMEEYGAKHMPAVNIAGVYNQASSEKWRESLNAPNPFFIRLKIDGEELSLPNSSDKVVFHEQSLDITKGIHVRKTIFKTAKGNVTVETERFAGMTHFNALALKYSVTADYDCVSSITSGIDGEVWDINGPHFVNFEVEENSVKGICENGVSVMTSAKGVPFGDMIGTKSANEEKTAQNIISFNAKKDAAFGLTKVAFVQTSIDEKISKEPQKPNFLLKYDTLLEEQKQYWKDFWQENFVEIEGDEKAETALNYSIYSLQIIAPRHANALSIPARGLSGQVYKGAVFWDTDMFMLDYFILNDPETAKILLKYRVDGLKGALEKADREGYNGAFYAWESHEDGIEACSKFNVTDIFTGRAVRTYFDDKQVHISSAIVYGIKKYIKLTGDTSILFEGGFDVIVECANFYLSLLTSRVFPKMGEPRKLEILDVVGPDEYHERVNNNAYTNRMAKFVFEFTLEVLDLAKKETKKDSPLLPFPEVLNDLKNGLKKIIPDMIDFAVNDEGVIEQFDGYFDLEDVSVDVVRSRLKDPREYWGGSNGVAYPTQIIKQADVVTMLAMFKDEFEKEIMKANLDYYEPRTEHGSSLSACMYGLLQCFCGMPDTAYPMFLKSAEVDLAAPKKLWAGGIYIGGSHPASWGGAYQMLVYGFAGLKHNKDQKSKGKPNISFDPHLPKHWKSISFHLTIQGKKYKAKITHKKVVFDEVKI